MAALAVRCNVCFRLAGREAVRFFITSCGHVLCEMCLQKGKKDECAVCRSPCRTIFLSNETNPDVKMLFMDINSLCKKYSKEFTQICEFQESHRRRSLAYYKGKIAKLEETVKKLTQQVQSMEEYRNQHDRLNTAASFSLRPSQSYCSLTGSSAVRNSGSTHSENQTGYSSYFLPHPRQSVKMAESMEVDPQPSKRNIETITGPSRLLLISPPQDGRMGQVAYRSTSQTSIPGSLRPSQLGSSQQLNVLHQLSQSSLQSSRTASWDTSSQRAHQVYQPTPQSSQLSSQLPGRQMISLANILHRQSLNKQTP